MSTDFAKLAQQLPISFITGTRHRLRPEGPVPMHYCGNTVLLAAYRVERGDHERLRSVVDQVLRCALDRERRAERTEAFPVFDSCVDNVFVPRAARTHEDGPVSERPRAALHSALEPADNLVLREQIGGSLLNVINVNSVNASVMKHCPNIVIRIRWSGIQVFQERYV